MVLSYRFATKPPLRDSYWLRSTVSDLSVIIYGKIRKVRKYGSPVVSQEVVSRLFLLVSCTLNHMSGEVITSKPLEYRKN
jgi:hypothetical protein